MTSRAAVTNARIERWRAALGTAAINTNGSIRVRCTGGCQRWFTPHGRVRPVCDKCEPPKTLRKFPPAAIGDMFGTQRVVALLERDATCNERVEAQCERCGNRRVSYVFNLRKASAEGCRHCRSKKVGA